ncbi:putative 2-aminoethylphosphonate ABC transporter permease subunit, partial [Pseudomonas sp. MWU12-2115]
MLSRAQKIFPPLAGGRLEVEKWAATVLVWGLLILLLLGLGLPLLFILGRAALDQDGDFAGLANFVDVWNSP